MKAKKLTALASLALAAVLALGMNTLVSAQGRGGGHGNAGGGRPAGAGNPGGGGVDTGLGTASTRSGGRSDAGLGNADTRSNGRSSTGIDRARMASENSHRADVELREHPRLADATHMNANDLRGAYQTALQANPNLTFGQFVAANMLARNLGTNNPAITTDAILSRLASGMSIGRSLQDLGLSSSDAKTAKKQVDNEIKASKRH